VADRVLHEALVAMMKYPRATSREERGRRGQMATLPVLLAVEHQAKEGGLEEEGEGAFHGQRLADDPPA